MLRTLGADAVGMSTVMEAIAARWAGLRLCGVSLVTNPGAGISDHPLSHEEVLEAADGHRVEMAVVVLPVIDRQPEKRIEAGLHRARGVGLQAHPPRRLESGLAAAQFRPAPVQ